MIYFQLFWSFFQIGLFSIGGGYAAMPLIQEQVVDLHGWISMKEFADIVTIAEMTPGPIAVNSATFVGTQVAGFPGALAATLGNVCPSCIIIFLLAYLYYKYRSLSFINGVMSGLRPAVIAFIASAGLSLLSLAVYGQRTFPSDLINADFIALIIFVAAFIILRIWKVKPVYIMISAGIVYFAMKYGKEFFL